MITLRGCGTGNMMQWRFPTGTKKCPMTNCYKLFTSRSNAIAHYRECHAKHMVLCPHCIKPISIKKTYNWKRHFQYKHPNQTVPSIHSKSNVLQNERDNDMIVLRGYGRIMKWRFPITKKCPVKKCNRNFSTRSAAIVHFETEHASNYTLCSICYKPISVLLPSDYKKHFRRVHPIQMENETFKTNAEILNTVVSQSPELEICPLPDCVYNTSCKYEMRIHWNRKHCNLRLPKLVKPYTNVTQMDEAISCQTIEQIVSIQMNFQYRF